LCGASRDSRRRSNKERGLNSIPVRTLDRLFAALLATAVGVFAAGNALLANIPVLIRILPIAAVSLGVLASFYAFIRLMGSPLRGLIAIYIALLIAVYGPQNWTVPLLILMILLGAIYTLLRLRLTAADIAPTLGMATIGTAAILGASSACTSFDMIERMYAGHIHRDTLYHASMAAMIKNYGVVSTGLNGLIATPYHALSHALFAAISLSTRAPILEVYGVANVILFAPLLIFAVVACCMMMETRQKLDPAKLWSAVCLLLACAPRLFGRWAVWDAYFVSESYLVSLSLLLLALPLLAKTKLSGGEYLSIAVAAAFMAAAKASTGLVFVVLICMRLALLARECKTREVLMFCAVAAIVAAVVAGSAMANQGNYFIKPFDFIEEYSALGRHLALVHDSLLTGLSSSARTWLLACAALGSFIVLHFFVSWCVIADDIRRLGFRAALKSPATVFSLGVVGAGLIIVASFRILGGSAYYFTNVAFFISLPAAGAALVAWVDASMFEWRPIQIAMTGLVVCVSFDAYWNLSALSDTRTTVGHSVLVQRLLSARDSVPRDVVLRADADMLAENPMDICAARPFLFPALSERPWIGVITPGPDCSYFDYGYDNYRISPESSQPTVPPRLSYGKRSLAITSLPP
jgi:hypothetical protein